MQILNQAFPFDAVRISKDNTAVLPLDDVVLCDATTNNISATLPATASLIESNTPFTLVKIDASSHTVTITPAAGETINGASSYVLSDPFESVTLIANANARTWTVTAHVSSSSASGITQLTGDVTAGPGSGTVAATIAALAVTTGKLADNAVTTVKITDANVTTAKLADASVTTAKHADASVTTVKVADGAITEVKMTLADNTTWNFGTGAHGFAPKSPGGTAAFLRADGSWSTTPDNGITQLTGDVLAGPGNGSQAATLSSTGVSAGTYNNVVVDVKGRVTSGSNVAYLTANQTITLSGAVSGSGSTSITTTANFTGFYATRITSDQSITTAATKLGFNSATIDTDSAFSTVNNRYTPKKAGKWLFILNANFLDGSTNISNNGYLYLYKNGSAINLLVFSTTMDTYDNESANGGGTIAAIVSMNGTTDYVEGFCANSQSTTTFPINTTFKQQFSGVFLGA